MTIQELKEIINSIPNQFNDLNVWIDSEESEGGRPVELVELKFAEDCCLDGDEGSENLYSDEVFEMLNVEEIPEEDSFEFQQIIQKLNELNYRWEGGECFSKKILAIKF